MPLTARAHAVAELLEGRTRLTALRSQPPLSLRETVGGLTLVASAFGPLGGDRTSVSVRVGAGAALAVGSAGAQVAQPGAHDAVSRSEVELAVGAGGSLRWEPEPLVVTAGAEHRLRVDVRLAEGARLVLAETVVLGRAGAPAGRYRARWRVAYADRPLLASDLDVGDGAPAGWDGPAVLGGARVLVTALYVGVEPPAGCEVLDLAGPGRLVSWLGSDTVAARRLLRGEAVPA